MDVLQKVHVTRLFVVWDWFLVDLDAIGSREQR